MKQRAGIFYDFERFLAGGQAAQRAVDALAGELALVEDLVGRYMAAAALVYRLDELTKDHNRYVPLLEQLNAQIATATALRDHLRERGR
jgi:hypothetical protein